MKKVLAILICTLTLNAHATEMCARDDTVVVPLDATLNLSGNLFSNKDEWMVGKEFSYGGIVMGGTCLSLNDIREIEAISNISEPPNILSTSDERLLGRYGWYNGDETNPENARKYCYYQMTHPMLSRWVNIANMNSEPECYSGCINQIDWYGLSDTARRQKLFDTIGR